MPINGAQLHALTHFISLYMVPNLGRGPAPGHQAAEQVQRMERRKQVKESVGRVRGRVITELDQLLPGPKLPGQEGQGEPARPSWPGRRPLLYLLVPSVLGPLYVNNSRPNKTSHTTSRKCQ